MRTELRLIVILLAANSVFTAYYKEKGTLLPMTYVILKEVREQPPPESLGSKYFNLFYTNPSLVPQQVAGGTGDRFNVYKDNLTEISARCPRGAHYASYDPSHKSAVSYLHSLYSGENEFTSLLEAAEHFRQQSEVHPHVWYASFIRAQASRMPDTLSMARPSPINVFPTSFFPDALLQQPQTNDQTQNQQQQTCRLLDETFGQDNGIENRLWYFREDVQLNAHHWIWHLLFPVASAAPIDRRGEFFYFFHHELIARYTAERLVNGLAPPIPFNIEVNSIVEEGYNPHLRDGVSSIEWAPRSPFQQLATVLNSTLFESLLNTTTLKTRVLDTILRGEVLRRNVFVPIHTFDNVNILGELAESSNHSINNEFYGTDGYHNEGHWIFANLIGNAPQGSRGVMGHVATAMRDVIFYRWHKLVDLLFLAYKATHLAPYHLTLGEHPLVVEGVTITDFKIIPAGGQTDNSLYTFFSLRNFQLEGGLDFNSDDLNPAPPNVAICAKHLNHEEFTYRIHIINSRPVATLFTVRIFMAPRYKSLLQKYRYTIAEQRSLFFTMDSFQTILEPGENVLERRSEDSTVTAPWPKSIQQIRQEIESNTRGRTDCECGFPHHMLLPRGTETGTVFDVFVMLTDGAADFVAPLPVSTAQQQRQQNLNIEQCTPSHVHCGIQGRNYPDGKPMGYPFDRVPYSIPTVVQLKGGKQVVKELQVKTLEDYVSQIPNTAATQVVIVHRNVLLESPAEQNAS